MILPNALKSLLISVIPNADRTCKNRCSIWVRFRFFTRSIDSTNGRGGDASLFWTRSRRLVVHIDTTRGKTVKMKLPPQPLTYKLISLPSLHPCLLLQNSGRYLFPRFMRSSKSGLGGNRFLAPIALLGKPRALNRNDFY